MSTADTYVRSRIDTATKKRASEALESMGLSISDAIRLLMLRIADEHRLPFEVKHPTLRHVKPSTNLKLVKASAQSL
jgi:DNA-damage-inducible protein J